MTSFLAFDNPWALALVPLTWIFLGFLAHRERQRTPVIRITGFAAFAKGPSGLASFRRLPGFLRLAATTLLILCIARPQSIDQGTRDVTVEGIDIVVALDVSTSMLAADFKPRNRISVAKAVLNDFIEARPNDRIGLVVFAGEAYTQAPLTFDHHVLTSIMDSVKTGLIEDGTAIGNAVATALNRLRDSEAKSRVVILITDGDNNSGNISPMEAAAIAKDLGIQVYTIVVGKGGKVPYPTGPDFFGKTVYQDVELAVNPELLKSIAETTGGAFYQALDKKGLESGLHDILDHLEKTEIDEGGTFQNKTELFPPFMLLAIALLVLGLALSLGRLRRFP